MNTITISTRVASLFTEVCAGLNREGVKFDVVLEHGNFVIRLL